MRSPGPAVANVRLRRTSVCPLRQCVAPLAFDTPFLLGHAVSVALEKYVLPIKHPTHSLQAEYSLSTLKVAKK
jgi:hypothetical protein